ncbi:MAG: FtsX-like permease family protein, partial [Cyclobacteriaceae bacterium]
VGVMTTSSAVPGKGLSWGTAVKQKAQSDQDYKNISLIAAGDNYDKAYGLQLLAGRLMEKNDNPWGNGNVVINEKAVEELGFDSPEAAIGQRLSAKVVRNDLIIRGVVGNHNHQSLKENYVPVIYMVSVWSNYYTVKLDISDELPVTDQLAQVETGLSLIRTKWDAVFPYATFEYFFLDEEFDALYKKDRQFGLIFGLFSGLAIIIASLGLLGLSSFSIARRTKEIGVRKVLGASDAQVVKLLSKEYVILIIVANLIAVPLAWYFLSSWLENYHFRISLGWWMAVIPLVIVLLIAIGTISIKVFRVASGNPINSLRYE